MRIKIDMNTISSDAPFSLSQYGEFQNQLFSLVDNYEIDLDINIEEAGHSGELVVNEILWAEDYPRSKQDIHDIAKTYFNQPGGKFGGRHTAYLDSMMRGIDDIVICAGIYVGFAAQHSNHLKLVNIIEEIAELFTEFVGATPPYELEVTPTRLLKTNTRDNGTYSADQLVAHLTKGRAGTQYLAEHLIQERIQQKQNI